MLSENISIDLSKLFLALCTDLAIHSSTVDYCYRRFKNEGVQFFTVTLPKLSALVLEAIEINNLSSLQQKYTCFRWKSGAPFHFKWLTDQIFDKNGAVKPSFDALVLYQVRQFSQYMYKLALPFTEDQLERAEADFIKVEEAMATSTYDIAFVDRIRKNVETFYVFPSKDSVLASHRPRNGPGTFSKDCALDVPWYRYKYSCDVFNTSLKRYKAISGFFRPYPSCDLPIRYKEEDTASYSEVLFVPKDSRGPRVIMREPLHALQLQMSFFDWFSSFLERETHNQINFTDQTINRRLAELGSKDGRYATIDLKEASDRVSYSVIKQIARNIPVLNWFLKSCRTSQAKLPSGTMINLSKLAGMGSGLTFVFLSFLIHSAVATEISAKTGLPFGAASRHVWTYGDDLIVPICYVQEAQNALRKVDLLVNTGKSYMRKHYHITKCFRESCGGDYYGGADVSIARLKLQNCALQVSGRIMSVSGTQAIVMVSEHAGETHLHGLTNVSNYLYKELEKCTGPLPLIGKKGSVIGRLTRSHVSYNTDKTGAYKRLRVICAVPVLVESPEQHSYYPLANALRPKVGAVDAYNLGGTTGSMDQYTVALPRTVKYVYKRVSAFSVMR